MTAPVKRHDGIPGKTLAEMYDKLASDYERLEQECERLRLDNLSKNGSVKGLGAQIAALQRAVKNRDKLKARAEAERDTLRDELDNMKRSWGLLHAENESLRADKSAIDLLNQYIVTGYSAETDRVVILADSGTLRDCMAAALQAKP